MPIVDAISKKTDNLWVVGLVAGTICGLSKGLYDRKTYNSISGLSRKKSREQLMEMNDSLPGDDEIAEGLNEIVTKDDFTDEIEEEE